MKLHLRSGGVYDDAAYDGDHDKANGSICEYRNCSLMCKLILRVVYLKLFSLPND